MIVGGGGWYSCGMETTMDGGGPDGKTIGGGLLNFFGKLTYMGPEGGAGMMTWAGGGGKGGSRAKNVFLVGDPGWGSRPDADNVFSSGNNTDGGTEEINAGADEDTAASSTSTTMGDSPSRVAGDEAIAFRSVTSVAGGRALKSSGFADRVFTTDTSAEGGKASRVEDDEHRAASSATTGAEPLGEGFAIISGLSNWLAPSPEHGTSATPFEP